MEIENLWSLVKTFYFRNENVILRVPFCFFLQLATYIHMIVKESKELKEEDMETWYASYEFAGTHPPSWLLKISSRAGKKKLVSFWLKLVHLFLPASEFPGVAGDAFLQKCLKNLT